ncbi:putative patatin-like phospholipase [hydrothermal vent metagenome]|uniref:Putative patatin-like phospholipase n=1 Tax=hydrothermal vent metagenome TaxID=652676 RepID=A0A3B0URL3_9ZZZZ
MGTTNQQIKTMKGKLFLAVVMLLFVFNLYAYDKNRPKIGLVLSGGGARGLAHIGVLRALEEKQIPIDYIAGTSMGSIIGGLYATGMSTDDLEWVVRSIDWERVFRPTTERKKKHYRAKQEEKSYFVDLEIGLSKEGPKSGVGFAGGQQLMLELQRIVGSLKIQDFDAFPIPFRAVATDLNAAEPYIIKDGDLAMAMRASMAVPLVFGPVQHQGRFLADGGILNNLPVDVAKAMGADIIIAVNISSPLKIIDEESSIIAVSYQSIDVALVQNTIRSLGLADIVIAPDLKNLGAADFDKYAEFIQAGINSVAQKSLVLDHLSLNERDYLTSIDSRSFLMQEIPKQIEFVVFSGNKRTSLERLSNKTKHIISKPFVVNEIQDLADVIAVDNDILTVTYKVIDNDLGQKGIEFKIEEKNWGPDYLKFGLKVADDFDSNTRITLLAKHHRYNINRKGAEWSNDISVGTVLQWRSELNQPLDYADKYFVSANLNMSKDSRRFYGNIFNPSLVGQAIDEDFDIRPTGEYDIKDFGLGIDFGININDSSEFRAGFWFLDQSIVSVINDSEFKTAINRTTGLRFRYGLDTLDTAIYAHTGIDLKTEIGLFDKVQWLNFDIFQRFAITKNSAFHLGFQGDFVHNAEDGNILFAYGGLDNFAGYPEFSLLGLNAIVFEAGAFTKWDKINLPIFGSPKFMVKIHYGNVWQHHIDLEDMIYGYSTGVSVDVANTVLFLGNGYSSGGDFRFYLRLGTGF